MGGINSDGITFLGDLGELLLHYYDIDFRDSVIIAYEYWNEGQNYF